MKDYKKAVEDYNVVLKEKANDDAVLDRRAFAYWNMKEYDKAIADFSHDHQGQAEGKGRLSRSELRLRVEGRFRQRDRGLRESVEHGSEQRGREEPQSPPRI